MLSCPYGDDTFQTQRSTTEDSLQCIYPCFEGRSIPFESAEDQSAQSPSADRTSEFQVVRLFPESGDRKRLVRQQPGFDFEDISSLIFVVLTVTNCSAPISAIGQIS